MSKVRPIGYVSSSDLEALEERLLTSFAEHFKALEDRIVIHESVLAHVVVELDDLEVEIVDEEDAEDFEVDDEEPFGPEPTDEDIDEAVAAEAEELRAAAREKKAAAGAEAKEAAEVAPVTYDDTPPAPTAGPLDPIEAANQVTNVGEEGRTVE